MSRPRKSDVELRAARWLRALTIAKILFEDQGYHTRYLEEIEQFIQRREVMQQMARFEVRSALKVWLSSGTRTLERLETLVRHLCEVHARDKDYTQEAIHEATRLAARHLS